MDTEFHQITPLAAGQRHKVVIIDVAFGGEGVARIGDFVAFVPFVVTGEEVEVEITEVKKRYARARLVQVLQSSPDRVAPLCAYFGACGGCQYQHVSYEAQLRIKHKQIVDLFERLGRFGGPSVEPIHPCPQGYGYRNRIMVRSQWDKYKEGLNLGFLRHDNRLVVDVEECKIAEPSLNEQLQRLRVHPPPKGGIKIVLRVLPADWEVPRDSFFQNNFFLLPQLVTVVRQCLLDAGCRHLVDAYCGVGFFSLELADLVESYAGFDIDGTAIGAACRNAALRSRINGEFRVGSADNLLMSLLRRHPPAETAVIVDPPRTGCSPEVVQMLRAVRPAQVLYVSCHPATLARDLNALCDQSGYQLGRVVPLDMFPQTQHIECVVDLRAGSHLDTAAQRALPVGEDASSL